MNPAPPELVELRERVARSYRYRKPKCDPITADEYRAMDPEDRKGWQWQANPELITQLVAAERDFTHQIATNRQENAQ